MLKWQVADTKDNDTVVLEVVVVTKKCIFIFGLAKKNG